MSLTLNDLWTPAMERYSVDSTPAEDITSGAACIVYGIWYAHGGGMQLGKVYNALTAAGTDYIAIRKDSTNVALGISAIFPPGGVFFDTGLSMEITGGTPDADTRLWVAYKVWD